MSARFVKVSKHYHVHLDATIANFYQALWGPGKHIYATSVFSVAAAGSTLPCDHWETLRGVFIPKLSVALVNLVSDDATGGGLQMVSQVGEKLRGE